MATDIDANNSTTPYVDALDDVHTRFVLNLPEEELQSADRIFFQLEQAWWFYDDFYCDSNPDELVRFSSLKPFAKKMFAFSPLLRPMCDQFESMWAEFMLYKNRISTYGTILLNQDCTKVVLCQTWKGKSWTVPSGKVNQGETGIQAGARETYEETGFDPSCSRGLTKQMKLEAEQATKQLVTDDATPKRVLGWQPLREEDALVYVEDGTGKRRTCYVCRGVPENFPFEPVARKEVGQIAWHDLTDLPKKSHAVIPFLKELRRWINVNYKKQSSSDERSASRGNKQRSGSEASQGKNKQRSDSRGRSGSRNGSRGKGRVKEGDDIANTGLAEVGGEDGWTEEDMFSVNEQLLGRKIEYDGNPHKFIENNEDGMACHRFKVVGGTFMNSGEGITSLIVQPPESRLQPLFARAGKDKEEELQPFFTDDGRTPWGEVVSAVSVAGKKEAKPTKSTIADKTSSSGIPLTSKEPGDALLDLLKRHGGEGNEEEAPPSHHSLGKESCAKEMFLTDTEITARSQEQKLGSPIRLAEDGEDEDLRWMNKWVCGLRPSQSSTNIFKFDMPPILEALYGKHL